MSDLSYGAPPRTSSGLSFHGGASPIPIPVPAPASSLPGPSSGLPSSLESSSDKENSAPGTQQSVVTELVAVIEEEHLDIGGESGHVMARLVEAELVRSGSSEGPVVSERVQMATAISRPTTAQMVLGREALYLPDDHPLLQQIQSSVTIQGRVVANSDGPALT